MGEQDSYRGKPGFPPLGLFKCQRFDIRIRVIIHYDLFKTTLMMFDIFAEIRINKSKIYFST